jgi:hypothetical protein
MRKYYVFAAAALVVLAACQKKGNEANNNQEGPANTNLIAMPDWVSNENLAVPIEMGTPNITTKGLPITDATTAGNFNNSEFTYAVLALQTTIGSGARAVSNTVMPGFTGGVLARNVNGTADAAVDANPGGTGDVLTGRKVAQFGDFSGDGNTWKEKKLYYPYLYSAGTYNFYGYRVEDPAQNANPTLPALIVDDANNSITTNVTLGPCDIIWAKAEPNSDLEDLSSNAYTTRRQEDDANHPAEVAKGFTAKYIRGARWAVAQHLELNNTPVQYTDFLPSLAFEHITSQIQFMVKAYDQLAANTLANANVEIQSIVVGGTSTSVTGTVPVSTTASLDVKTGTLESTATGTISVSNIPNTFQVKYFAPNTEDAAAACGDPLFIMPTPDNATGDNDILVTLNLTLPGLDEPQAIEAKLHAPAIPAENNRPAVAEGRFAKGYAYKFTISLMSLEKIQIITSIADWIDAPDTEPIVID